MPEEKSHREMGPLVYTCLLAAVNVVYFGGALFVSYITHCLTLRMDCNYVLFIVGSLIVSIIDFKYRNVRSLKNTFGWARIEFLGNLFNATFLLSLSFSAAVESVQQLILMSGHDGHTHGVHAHEAIKIIAVGGVRFVIGMVTFATRIAMRNSQTRFRVNYTQNAGVELCVVNPTDEPTDDPASRRSFKRAARSPVLLPNLPVALLREIIGPVSLLVVGSLVHFYAVAESASHQHDSDGGHNHTVEDTVASNRTNAADHENAHWYQYADPGICLLQILVLGLTMFYNAKESGLALMLTIPQHLDIMAIQKRLIEKFPIILAVHDFHLWRSSRHEIVVTCHLVCTSLSDYVLSSSHIDRFFHDEGVAQVTIQPEVLESENADPQINETMTPNACACCDASPKCCSLKEASDLQTVRKRIIAQPPPEMVDLEIPPQDKDSGTDEPGEVLLESA